MLEVVVVIACFLLLCSVILVLSILLVIKVAENVIGAFARDVHNAVDGVTEGEWRQADASERDRMVRRACGWRVLGRVIAAGAMIGAGAFVVTSPGLIFGCCMGAWRLLSPVRSEMREACGYKSTGAEDEPQH